ncbi:DUF1194 domain-containing protein [Roseibium denhamense]|nr:DUF1194 domain-containing protein [Roseibium denhamense]MTI05729.1 DUF1194 domain-containing protein [Roseibium denhamense]
MLRVFQSPAVRHAEPRRHDARVFRWSLSALAASALLILPGAQANACALALVLAMDSSASVDEAEYTLQMEGLAAALTDPEVVGAIETVGGIYLNAFEWSGRYQQSMQLDWQFIDGAGAAQLAAAQLRRKQRAYNEFPTALGYALGFAAVQMKSAPQRCARQVVDVAGDGVNNAGFGPQNAYKAFDFTNITVNGLVIEEPGRLTVDYYAEEVIRGAGAFVEVANGFDDYERAMKRKLVREIFGSGYAALP